MATEGGGGQGARLAGRAGDLVCIIFRGQVGCMVGGAQKEVEALGLPGWHYLGSLFCPAWLQAFSPAPTTSAAVPLAHSLSSSISNLLVFASDVPFSPEECSVHFVLHEKKS